MYKIPVYQPSLSGNEKKYVNDCIDSSWISSKGKYISEFEQKFSEAINVKYATTVTSGTTGLHIALITLGIKEGDEVIVPTLTYIASVNAITYTGATPVFVDSLPDTWQMDPNDVRKKISKKTKAIVVVHLYGHPCDMEALKRIADEYHLYIVEDCAEAFGSLYQGKSAGSFGDISVFSFYGNKTITTGEGGMVVTNNKTLYDRAYHFKGQGLAKMREYWHDVVGYNYRMTNICAAIGLAQLEQANVFLEKKRKIAQIYKENLSETSITFQIEAENVKNTYWMFSILVDQSRDRDPLRNYLEKNGIETRPLFYPVHTMPIYAKDFQCFPIAENLGWRGINLPSYPDLHEEQIIHICDSIKQYLQTHC